MARQPTVGGDFNAWGSVLNTYLSVAHDGAGNLQLFSDCGAGGTSDDTTACQAALTAGKNVVFRQGATYTISSELTAVSGQNIWAHGATIIKKHGVTNMPGLLYVGEGVTNVRIYGGTWDGDRFNDTIANPNYQYNYYAGIRMQGCRDVWLTGCVVRNNYSHGFFMGGQSDQTQVTARISLTDCRAYGNMDGGFSCRPSCIHVWLTSCNAWANQSSGFQFIRSNKINVIGGAAWQNGPDQANEGDGYDTQGCWDVLFSGCQAWGNSRGGFGILDTIEGGPGSGTGYTWESTWAAATSTYVKGQVVQYHGESYIALQAVPTGTPPIIEANSTDTDPYWRLCPYDSGASQSQNGTLTANEKYSQNVKLTSCQALRNAVYANRGVYSAGTTYSNNDSVYYNTTGSESAALDVYICKVTSSTGTVPTNATNWTLGTDGSGHSDGWGFFFQGVNGVTCDDCESSYNGDGAGFGTGFLASYTIQNLIIRNGRALGNNGYGFRSTQPDKSDSNPIELDNCVMDSATSGIQAAQLLQSTYVKGGTYARSTQANILVAANAVGSGTTSKYVIDGVTLIDAQGSVPAIQTNGTASGATVYVDILRCTFPNSSSTGNAYAELSPTGTTVSFVDQCGFGTTTRTTITTLNFTAGMSAAGSAVGRLNYALTGSSSVAVGTINAQTSNYTLLNTDDTVAFNISGVVTATLPSAATCRVGKRYTVVNVNASTHALTLTASAGSVPTASIAAASAVTVISDGTNWQSHT